MQLPLWFPIWKHGKQEQDSVSYERALGIWQVQKIVKKDDKYDIKV